MIGSRLSILKVEQRGRQPLTSSSRLLVQRLAYPGSEALIGTVDLVVWSSFVSEDSLSFRQEKAGRKATALNSLYGDENHQYTLWGEDRAATRPAEPEQGVSRPCGGALSCLTLWKEARHG